MTSRYDQMFTLLLLALFLCTLVVGQDTIRSTYKDRSRCSQIGQRCIIHKHCCGLLRCAINEEICKLQQVCSNDSETCRKHGECCHGLMCGPVTQKCFVPKLV